MVTNSAQRHDIAIDSAQPDIVIDPNVTQRRASNPQHSVWVNASAGTGKTKILTDRVLRLLLPQTEKEPGTNVHKILCLTFTKAGANEMALRLQKTLSDWAVMPEEQLEEALKSLLGTEPQLYHLRTARRLFADVMDVAGGLQIMTIHSFCQSLLGRFPIEAGLPFHFQLIDEFTARDYLLQAQNAVFQKSQKNTAHDLSHAISSVARVVNQDQFAKLLSAVISERRQLRDILKQNFDAHGIYTNLCRFLDVVPGRTPEEMMQDAFTAPFLDDKVLKHVVNVLAQSSKETDLKNAGKLDFFLSQEVEDRAQHYQSYAQIFLTTKGQKRKRLYTKEILEDHADVAEFLEKEADRLFDLSDQLNAAQIAQLTYDLITVTSQILDEYEKIKRTQAVLDYDDLILKSLDLLQVEGHEFEGTSMRSWVHYKLDQGIDHVLVDEAQDTNPEQWQIISALCEEFFAGESLYGGVRTVFVVGDEKQSIYSFQRASPQAFEAMRAFFAQKVHQVEKGWNEVDLNISFRSSTSVLEFVDAVFADPSLAQGLQMRGGIHHKSFRRNQGGLVELWPLFESEEREETEGWALPISVKEQKTGAEKLAQHIAATMRRWLDKQEILPSHGRSIEPGDVMILLRKRGSFMQQIARALTAQNIPVSGVDRIVLSDQLAVQDLMALIQFCLLTRDDLNLACVLKSPLIGLDEETLFEIAHGREGDLWQALQASSKTEITEYLNTLKTRALTSSPYVFLQSVLHMPCPADDQNGMRAFVRRLGPDVLDIVDELLSAALTFEKNHSTSLQQFLYWQTQSGAEVKREQEEKGQVVRIMTVHGSKGLQAPIVILPDTIRTTDKLAGEPDTQLLWPDKTGLGLPLWSPRSQMDSHAFRAAQDTIMQRHEQEYRRLLYVAMTRAEDRLYIGAYADAKKPIEQSWYNYMRAAFARIDHAQRLEDGTLRITNPQIDTPDRAPNSEVSETAPSALPDWIFRRAAPEPSPARPLMPSRQNEDLEPVQSPLLSGPSQRFLRGNVIHKLLEFLPEIDPDVWRTAAIDFTDKFAAELDQPMREEIVTEVLNVLNHPEFAPIFSENSRAEVPVSGMLSDHTLVSAQIDRLLITDKIIWIVDFKSNRPPPSNEVDIPEIYRKQMQTYAELMRQIYPGRKVKAGLLWTDVPRLMVLSDI